MQGYWDRYPTHLDWPISLLLENYTDTPPGAYRFIFPWTDWSVYHQLGIVRQRGLTRKFILLQWYEAYPAPLSKTFDPNWKDLGEVLDILAF